MFSRQGHDILRAVHVSKSLEEDLTDHFWGWMHVHEDVSLEDFDASKGNITFQEALGRGRTTAVYSKQGQRIIVPSHLRPDSFDTRSIQSLKQAMDVVKSRVQKVMRKPTPHQLGSFPSDQRARLFVHVIDFKLKLDVGSLYCVVKVNDDRYVSMSTEPQKRPFGPLTAVARLHEAFVFDIPSQDVDVDIALYAPRQKLVSSSSMHQLRLIPSQLKKSKSMDIVPAEISEPMNSVLIGEVHCSLPFMGQPLRKTTGLYDVNVPGQEPIGKAALQFGFYFDEMPADEREPFKEYLNFYLRTRKASIWRKYWCVLNQNELLIYDFEYKETRPPVARLSKREIRSVMPAKDLVAPHTLEIRLNERVLVGDVAPAAGPSNRTWLSAAIHPRQDQGIQMSAYVSAASEDAYRGWLHAFCQSQ